MTRRHWNALSERYAGGDSLATALEDGWIINQLLRVEDYLYRGINVRVYHLGLQRGDDCTEMRVLSNPYVSRILATVPAVPPETSSLALQRSQL